MTALQTAHSARPETLLIDKKICLIDDDEDQLVILRRLLMRSKAKVKSFRSGLKAFPILAKDPPDVIILDIMMPDCDGWELYNLIRQDEKLKDVPVLFLSCLMNPNNAEFMADAQRCASLAKPVKQNQLYRKLAELLE